MGSCSGNHSTESRRANRFSRLCRFLRRQILFLGCLACRNCRSWVRKSSYQVDELERRKNGKNSANDGHWIRQIRLLQLPYEISPSGKAAKEHKCGPNSNGKKTQGLPYKSGSCAAFINQGVSIAAHTDTVKLVMG